MRITKVIFLALLSTLLIACGGGGGGGDQTPPTPIPISDNDNDGIADSTDSDDDNDGVPDNQDAFPFDASESLDTDNDGIGNNADNDDDGDGVDDTEDAFPLDSSETVDTDADGVGDNADVYPTDAVCHSAINGDGEQCYLTALKQDFSRLSIFSLDDHIAFYNRNSGVLLTLYAESGDFAAPVVLDLDEPITSLIYSPEHQRHYFGVESGQVYFIDSDGLVDEFVLLNDQLDTVAAAGQFIVAFGAYSQMVVIDSNGTVVSQNYIGAVSIDTKWDDATNSLIFNNISSDYGNTIWRVEISPTNGQITNYVERYVSDSSASNAAFIMPPTASDFFILGGVAYNKVNLQPLQDDMLNPSLHVWASNELGLVSLDYDAGNTNFTWLSNQLESLIQLEFDGSPIAVARSDESVLIITNTLRSLQSFTYTFVEDIDGDAINNTDDDFPTDRAASIDSDNDGYPDEWNAGSTEENSQTGLVLDAFPSEPVCWLSDHADNFGACDYAATMPNFAPINVIPGNDDIIFIYNNETRKIYVWDAVEEEYLRPIDVTTQTGFLKLAPSQIAYNQMQSRFYFTVDLTNVLALDYSDEETSEVIDFFTTSEDLIGGISHLVPVGNYMLLQNLDYYASHQILDINGGVRATRNGYYRFSNDFAWNAINNRLYHFIDGSSPNDLMYVEINPSNGAIVENGESPYHGDYLIEGPIVISKDGQQVILGSGDIYDADDLTWQGTYGDFDAALSLDNNEMLLLTQSGNSVQLSRRDGDNRELESRTLSATDVEIISTENTTLFVLIQGNSFSIERFIVNNDSDDDGVSNLNDAFPTDIAASVDTDNDGYPDSWNDGFDESDSTSGLILDAFPDDSACWTNEHGTPEGTCDFSATMPVFTPNQTLVDEAGIVYLFNDENGTVYRWSVETESYQNPLQVGRRNGFANTSPSKITYSETHRRLYFGYSTGEITFIDLDGAPQEQPFYSVPQAVGGLASVGEFVLVQDSSGAWNTHYIIGENGVLADKEDWNRYSREYAWNEANNRVYFFRDQTSPNDLHYEVINQNTGDISERGETPYHSGTNIRLPIRVINDGQHVILGSGVIYDANALTITHSLGYPIEDAASFDEIFAVVASVNSQYQLQIIQHDSWDLQFSQTLSTPLVGIFSVQNRLLMISQESDGFSFSFIQIGDADGDTMPAWWETAFGLSDEDASDALLDNDSDDLTNLQEYQLNSNPIVNDTDADGIIDGDEFYIYETDLLNADTDSDGLSDGDEVFTYGTLPLNTDTDDDTYSDGDEVLIYGTNPLDANSVPDAITSFFESFEGNSLPSAWSTTSSSSANWLVSDFEPTDGEQTVRSGNIDDNQISSLTFEALFASGTLSFDARVSAEPCCDYLFVYVNDEPLLTIGNDDWATYTIELSQGVNTIEWRYIKDGSVSNGEDSAFIDNVSFNQ